MPADEKDSSSLPDGLQHELARVFDLPEPARDAAVEALCHEHARDPAEIRGWLERMRRADEQLRAGAAAARTQEAPGEPRAPDRHPDRIGPYRVLEPLGEGGMGAVYKAEQHEPIRRLVAVKVVKLGMDTKEVLARFELERRALASMSHAAICKIFDAGATERGQPYFAMELVMGLPITTYCDRHKLSLAERLVLFQQVCHGVQHAHQKGVIHRDLKPGNVFVAREGDRAAPKILDFGLAKATNRELLAQTLFTEHDRILGTPEYMAPEQAAAECEAVDTRADIYALGVMLYELLTGALPFSGAELRQAGWRGMWRMLAEVEPQKPSTKLSSLAARGDEVAGRRRTSAHALVRSLRDDLDWIVMKALAKEPERRYDSAAAFAKDLQRHLDHEPVEAGPPSAAYRLRKLVRRYRTQVVAGALVMVATVAGAGVAVTFALVAQERARVIAIQKSELETRKSELETQKSALQARTSALQTAKREVDARQARFDQLAAVERLRAAVARQAELYPAWPNKLEAMRTFLAEDAARLRDDVPRVRTALAELRGAVPPFDETARETSRRSDERYPELERLRAELDARQLAHQVRTGEKQPLSFELDPAVAAKSASELNDLAWPLVRPDRTEFGREAEGRALAEAALQKARGQGVFVIGDTLAWAHFALGEDDNAKAAMQTAVDATRTTRQRAEYEGNHRKLLAAIESASGLERLQERVTDLAGALVAWQWGDESDRFLHDTLTKALPELVRFQTEAVPQFQQRIEWAAQIKRLTQSHPNAETTWDAAREAIAKADGIVASTLYARHPITNLQPQLGLVPIGMNPKTKLWDFYHLRSAWDPDGDVKPEDLPIPSPADYDPQGRLPISEASGVIFVLLPGGTFTMGSQSENPDQENYDEQHEDNQTLRPETSVAPFFLARHELTRAQWQRLTRGPDPSVNRQGQSFPSDAGAIGPTHPVEGISWNDCHDLVVRHGLALPQEKQWEYGCRAETKTPWWTGRTAASLYGAANVLDQKAVAQYPTWGNQEGDFDDGWIGAAPVGTYRPNGFGLFDVHGNVWEWGADIYEGSSRRVSRGGCFDLPARLTRSAVRSSCTPSLRNSFFGVRLARARRP